VAQGRDVKYGVHPLVDCIWLAVSWLAPPVHTHWPQDWKNTTFTMNSEPVWLIRISG